MQSLQGYVLGCHIRAQSDHTVAPENSSAPATLWALPCTPLNNKRSDFVGASGPHTLAA
jgi:hypothetical protein